MVDAINLQRGRLSWGIRCCVRMGTTNSTKNAVFCPSILLYSMECLPANKDTTIIVDSVK